MNNEQRVDKFSRAKLIMFSFIPLVVLLVIIEFSARAIIDNKTFTDTRAGVVIPDDKRIWRLRPIENGPLKTNSLGFRDTEPQLDDSFRVLLLGDSISWGDGIKNVQQVYPQLLEKSINDSQQNRKVEIINTGTPGYSTFQEAVVLQEYEDRVSADMVILQFCLNDVIERYKSLAEYGGDNTFLGINTADYIPGLNGFLLRHSVAYKFLYRLLVKHARNVEEAEVENLVSSPTPFIEKAWKKVFDEIILISNYASELKIPLLIAIAPYRFQLDDPGKFNRPQKTLTKFLSENNIPYIDLLPDFAYVHSTYPELVLFNDANHFSADGHALAAFLLNQKISPLVAK